MNGRTLPSFTSTTGVAAIGSKTPGPTGGWTYGTTSSYRSPVRHASIPCAAAPAWPPLFAAPARIAAMCRTRPGRGLPAWHARQQARPALPARQPHRPTPPAAPSRLLRTAQAALDGRDGVVHRPVHHRSEHGAARRRTAGGDRALRDAAPVDDRVLARRRTTTPAPTPAPPRTRAIRQHSSVPSSCAFLISGRDCLHDADGSRPASCATRAASRLDGAPNTKKQVSSSGMWMTPSKLNRATGSGQLRGGRGRALPSEHGPLTGMTARGRSRSGSSACRRR